VFAASSAAGSPAATSEKEDGLSCYLRRLHDLFDARGLEYDEPKRA